MSGRSPAKDDESIARALLRRVWDDLAGPPEADDRVRFHGWVPGLLPATTPCLAAMAAAVAAALTAIADVDAARGGHPPREVTVDVGHVAAAARSERYGHVVGEAAPVSFAPLSRFWRTADGRVRTHANYPWHRERLLGLLGCGGDPQDIQRALDSWSAFDLEQAAADAGALAYAVRSNEAWLAHPQGRAVAALPLLTAAPTAPAGRPPGRGEALEGLRVLDLTRVIAGPVATRTLAAWGADVLRLDSPRLPEVEEQTVDTLVGKRSARVDAATPQGRDTVEALLAAADIVISGYRPGALDKHGLAAVDLANRHPHLTVVTLSAWGRTGPWAGRRGFDSLVQAATGLAVMQAGLDGTPGVLPAQVLDHATGYLAAAAAAASVADVARGGSPRHCEVSLAQTSTWLKSRGPTEPQEPAVVDYDAFAVELRRPGAPVAVVSPPGTIGTTRGSWPSATRFGADAPRFG